MDTVLQTIHDAIMEGDRATVEAHVQEALEQGQGPDVILYQGMIPAMQEVGQLFEDGEYFVPEMLISARAMQSGMAILKPHLVSANVKSMGKVVTGTVKGDLHDIGKNLVAMMLEGSGFEIVDLGTDVSPVEFVEAVKSNQADLVAMSALLTTTMANMRSTIDALKTAGLRDQVKVMIGGAPVTDSFAEQIGADGYAPDASQAVRLARSLVE